jgi:hypothetical protein
MATENRDIEAQGSTIKIEVHSEIRITEFVARQNANLFLLNHFGNLVSAGDPGLQISGSNLCWKVPIRCAVPKTGMQTVGDLAVDVDTGEILLSASTPSDFDILHHVVDLAYASSERSALSPRD